MRELSYLWFTTITNKEASAEVDRDDDPLGPILHVSPNLFHGSEDSSGFHNILSISIIPFDVGRISFLEDRDRFSIDDEFPVLSLDSAIEFAVVESYWNIQTM